MIGRDFSADRVATPLGGSAGASWRNAAPVPPGRIVIRRSPAGVPGAPGESSRPAAGMVLGGPEPALPGREPGTVGRASSSRGERFLKTLALRRPDADRPLPVQLRPLADLVVGPAAAASVRVRTGPSTQAALAAAERPAATVGNVIHLDSPPTTAQRSVEILAHELVHASKPSPVARFLDDDRDSAEERQAARTALSVKSLIQAFEARSDAGSRGGAGHLTLGTAGLAVAPGASPLTAGAVGQLIAGRHNRGGGTGGAGSSTGAATVPAPTGGSAPSATGGTDAGMHRGRRNTGRHRPGSPTPGTGTGVPGDYLSELPPAVASLIANDRFDTPAFGGAPPFPGGVPSMPQPGFQPGYPPIPGRLPVGPILGGAMSGTSTAGPLVDQSVTPMSEETLDWIVEAVEERVLAELERRGIRFQPEVF